MSVSTHLVWLPRWSSTIQLYSRDTKILISKILFLCNMFAVLSSWQLLCDFSKQIKWINWNTMASPLFLCSKKDIFLQSFFVYWENLSYLLFFFGIFFGFFFWVCASTSGHFGRHFYVLSSDKGNTSLT